MTITAKHFDIRELVPEQVYLDRGVKAWELIDSRAIRTLDALREHFGPMIVNNWHMRDRPPWASKLRQWAGLRTPGCPWGTQYSQHQFGRAFDVLFRDQSAETVRAYILANPEKFPYIMSLELGVSWLHFDVRNCERIKTYTP